MKLTLALENCYGINRLNKEFDFTKSAYNNGVNSLYAPNGTLKTSLAKTFIDVVNNDDTKDLIFPERNTVRDIQIDNVDVAAEQLMIIESYNESYSSKQLSTLLVNENLKQQYDTALKEVDEKRTTLIKALAKQAGRKGVAVNSFPTVICEIFNKSEKDFLTLLAELHQHTFPDYSIYADYKFGDLFNDKVLAVIAKGDFAKELTSYVDTYDKLIEQSSVLTKSFNHQRAGEVSKSLRDADFFNAEHSVNISVEGKPQLAKNLDELNAILQAEQEKVLNSDELKQQFAKIDDKLKAKDTSAFRDFITENQTLLKEYQDIPEFKKLVIKSYLQAQQALWDDLVATYKQNQQLVENIIHQAKTEQTIWATVVELFNKRFTVPFKLSINNQDEVILNGQAPSILFEFDDGRDSLEKVNQESLMKALSQGEKRALYILNVLFELEVKKQQPTPVLIVIDDIADSFDYKNKYAIVEYLRDISNIAHFNLLLLTHNFDFHRIIGSRLIGSKSDDARNKRIIATKTTTCIELKRETYQNDVFAAWKKQMHNNVAFMLASIPFVRNLTEYCGFTGDKSHYNRLTSLLHLKPDSRDIKVIDLQTIYRDIFNDKPKLTLQNPNDIIVDKIYQQCDQLVQGNNETPELEYKVIIAMGIRLKAEVFMIANINDSAFVQSIASNQTRELFDKYSALFQNEQTTIELLDQVNLMTPENIHLNSFMYEPILDMSAHRLYELYENIKQLSDTD
ncbi:hypothetical protein tinsulaeT_13910 [Thalassotalea insulae]|uniref:Phage infection protein n=1 Tax=Thalassotalea insulae TaxID=2056778 RepID=A0ABQ6GV58_9GAMM|nr:hypothetical protein [Thalassotalea insulae]GLX78051.1 hypothetical protein tinsulaeT_13910 [Thalassotalea insulae]